MTGGDDPRPENGLAVDEGCDVGFVPPFGDEMGVVAGMPDPEIDAGIAGDAERVLKLADVMGGHAAGARDFGPSGGAAFDFQRAGGRKVDAIEAGALPRASGGDETIGGNSAAMGGDIQAAGLGFEAVVPGQFWRVAKQIVGGGQGFSAGCRISRRGGFFCE